MEGVDRLLEKGLHVLLVLLHRLLLGSLLRLLFALLLDLPFCLLFSLRLLFGASLRARNTQSRHGVLRAGGKLSTWLPCERLVEQKYHFYTLAKKNWLKF